MRGRRSKPGTRSSRGRPLAEHLVLEPDERIVSVVPVDDFDPDELAHLVAGEHVPHQAVVLAQVHAVAVARGDARRVLPPVLQHGQRIVKRRTHRAPTDDSNDSTHAELPRSTSQPK